MIASILFLSSCKSTAPKKPSYEECQLIRTKDPKDSYLYCLFSNDPSLEVRIRIDEILETPQTTDDAFVCTSLKSYIALKKYESEMNIWTQRNCR